LDRDLAVANLAHPRAQPDGERAVRRPSEARRRRRHRERIGWALDLDLAGRIPAQTLEPLDVLALGARESLPAMDERHPGTGVGQRDRGLDRRVTAPDA